MPASYMIPARFPVGGVPQVQYMQTAVNPSANFIRGSVVVATAGLIDLAGADPQLIAGVALAAPSSAPGFNAANSPTVTTGAVNKVGVAIANNETQFMARLTNNSNVTVAPTAADVGASYGITMQNTNEWTVDKSKNVPGQTRVVVTGIDVDQNRVFFKFLQAYQQFGGQ